VERQLGAKRYLSNADTLEDGLECLEPVTEDWHALMNFQIVSKEKHL